MPLVKQYKKTSLPGPKEDGETYDILTGGGTSYIRYVINSAGQAIPPGVIAHGHSISDVSGLSAALASKAGVVNITAGDGLSGGGPTSADVSLSVTLNNFSGRVRGANNYVLPAVGVNNSAFSSGSFEAYVSSADRVAGARPGIGFHAAGGFGTYLYANGESDFRIRTGGGADYAFWHSGNARSDAQNDARYSQIGHTQDWSTITGKPALLSGAGTATYVPRYATGGATLENSIMSVSATQFTAGGHIQAGAAGNYKQLLYGEANYGAVLFSGVSGGMYKFEYNTAGIGFTVDGVLTNAFYISRSNGSVSFPVPGSIPAPVSGLHIANKNYVDGSLANYVPTTRTITVNGQTGSLSGNVNLTVATGITSETDPIYVADRPGIYRFLGNVPDNSNFNDYNSTGFYGIPSNASAGSMSNSASNIAGTLRVERTGSFTFQEYFEYNSGRRFYRSGLNSAPIASGWRTSATEDYVNSQFTYNNVVNAIGYTPYNASNPNGYISGINGSMVTGALGYTPYNSTNPNGYINGINYNMVTTALGYEPMRLDRTITINGWTQNLRDNPVYSISVGSGTVTQVGLVAPTGFDVLSAPVTASGNLQFGLASGYSLVTSANRVYWNSKLEGSGSTNQLARFVNGGGVSSSRLFDSNSGNITSGANFQVTGINAMIMSVMNESDLGNIPNQQEGMIAYVRQSSGSGWGFWGHHGSAGWRLLATRVWVGGGGAP